MTKHLFYALQHVAIKCIINLILELVSSKKFLWSLLITMCYFNWAVSILYWLLN